MAAFLVAGLLLACGGGARTDLAGPHGTTTPMAAAGVAVAPAAATVATGATQAFSATVGGASSTLAWSVDGIAGGNASVGSIAAQPAGGASLRKAYYTAGTNKQTVAVQAGDLVIVGWTVGNSPGTTACADSAGNAYRQIASAAYTRYAGASAYAFYTIAQGGNSALNVAIQSVNPNSLGIFVQVVAGIKPDLASALDGAASKADSAASTSHATAAITTSAPGDYLFTLWGQDSQSTSLAENGSGFTILAKDTVGNAQAMGLQAAAGAAQEQVSTGRSVYMTSIVAAFKAASSGGSAVYTAPASGGVHTVTATSDAGTGSATVTVQAATQSAPVAMAVTPATASVTEGGSVNLSATVTNSANTAVAWTVDGIAGGNAAVGTVTGSGSGAVYTAPVGAGSHTVTATSVASATAFASCAITVKAATGTGTTTAVVLSPSTPTAVGSGGTVTFTASTTGNSGDSVTWSVDGVAGGNSTVGTINGGVYTAPSSSAKALRTITATSVASPSVTRSVRILTVASNTRINARTQYGAAGNGSTDDTAALQAAIKAAGGGICYVPAGTYLVNPAATSTHYALTIPSGTTLLLDPAATIQAKTFTGSGGYGALLMNQSNIAVVGGTIIGDRVARNLPTYNHGTGTDYEAGHGVAIGNGSTMFLLGVASRNNCCDGFYFYGNVSSVTLSDCVSDNNRRQGASIVYAHDLTFQYSTFSNTNGNDPACGINLEPNSGSSITGVAIIGCTVYGNAGGGIAGGGSLRNGPTGNGTAYCSRNSVTGCSIYGNGGSNYQLGGIWWDESSYITIANNAIRDNKADGIWLNYYARSYTVTGNTVTGNVGNGIYLADAAGTVVSGNTVTGNTRRQIYNTDGTASVGGNTVN